jgi:hypothetical protein
MSSIYDNYPAVRYVDEYDKDTDEQCVRCKGNCGLIGITGMWACKGFIPMTNYDRIISKTPEELAEWLYVLNDEHCDSVCPPSDPACPSHENCVECWLDWLRQEAPHAADT